MTKGSEYAFRVFPISNTFRTDTYFALLFVFVFDSPIPLPYLTPKSTPPTFSRVYVFATVNQHPPPKKKSYGSDYTGMDRFVSVHADQATGDIKCDHWHEGSGFLVHHLALSASLEISLRAVRMCML